MQIQIRPERQLYTHHRHHHRHRHHNHNHHHHRHHRRRRRRHHHQQQQQHHRDCRLNIAKRTVECPRETNDIAPLKSTQIHWNRCVTFR